jgi:hypothetical protein
MTYKELLTTMLEENGIIQHGELVPFLFKYGHDFMMAHGIDELFQVIDDMASKGELKRVEYTLPDSNNERVKTILLHPNAEIL